MTNMPFAALLTGFRGGAAERAASEKMNALLESIAMNGGKGHVTVKFDFKRDKYDRLEVVATVTAKAPEAQIAPGVYFLTNDNRLTQRDPGQIDIEDIAGLRRVREAAE